MKGGLPLRFFTIGFVGIEYLLLITDFLVQLEQLKRIIGVLCRKSRFLATQFPGAWQFLSLRLSEFWEFQSIWRERWPHEPSFFLGLGRPW